jgi:hypothetical protein
LVDMASENDDAIRRECFLALCTIMSCDFEEMVRYCGVLKHTNADEEGEEEAEVDEEDDEEEEEEEGSAQSTTTNDDCNTPVSRTLSMQAQAFKTVREGVRVYVIITPTCSQHTSNL